MPALSFSPPTSTSSHTLSASMDHPSPLTETLFSTLSSHPHTFLQPPQNLHVSALAIAKQFLDPLATDVTDVQTRRQDELRKKRKRGQPAQQGHGLLKLRKVHVDEFTVDQVWEQARRVLDAAREEVERALPAIEIEDEAILPQEGIIPTPMQNGVKPLRFDEEGFELSSSEEISAEEGDHLGSIEGEVEGESENDLLDEEEHSEDRGDSEDSDSENRLGSSEDDLGQEPDEEFHEDPNGLNDGFFSIDDFNRQTQLMEQRNQAEEEDDDDEEIDYFADPLALGANALSTSTSKRVGDSEEEDSGEEDGPTFGNMDLDAPEGASDLEEEDEDDEDMDAENSMGVGNANNVLYADFYAPPPKKAGKNKKKRGRPNPHNFPTGQQSQSKEGDNVGEDLSQPNLERTMAAVHRDLFSESEAEDDSDNALSDVDPGDPRSRRSTHERRQAKIAEEIRRLESANVAKRSWTLSGEARATDRPLNSLLEEDLDFERAGKPVPVITAEISEDIEALIKRRILSQEFDELIRRRPNDLATGSAQKRGLVDLPDTKSTKGLAEIYEEEHRARTDPSYVSAADAQTRAAHDEISALWKDVSGKLDALSSWHYRPKPAAPALEVRVDAPALSLEDARPTVGSEMGAAGSMLAPQEVYKPGADKVSGEVVTRGGAPVAREEMAREDKTRRRRREKERQKKARHNESVTIRRDGTGAAPTGERSRGGNEKKGGEKAVVSVLKKGGVKVIGKKGELTNVDGSVVQSSGGRLTGGSFKL